MFQRVLLPVDGTAGSERAVPYALRVAQALDVEVLVCHVITAPHAPNGAVEEREAAAYVERIAKRLRDEGVVARTLVRRGDPPLEINKAASEWNVDAIVMSTRSRQRLQKLMLGSVADVVVRDSRLPVLLVSSRHQAEERRSDAA